MYWVTSAFMHAKSIHTPCQKVCYNFSRNNIPPCTIHSSFTLQEGWHILYWMSKPISDFMQLLYHDFNWLPALRKLGLVQKDLESTLILTIRISHWKSYWKILLHRHHWKSSQKRIILTSTIASISKQASRQTKKSALPISFVPLNFQHYSGFSVYSDYNNYY